jgi:predicted metal-dependent enzyme (double-stranded beta helix superfamily)
VRSLSCKICFEKGELVTTASPALDTSELEKLSHLPTQLALRGAAPLLAHLVSDPTFLNSYVLPLLEEARRVQEGWYVPYRVDAQDGSYSLQIFVWPPATKTLIHDHTSWGAFCCAVGSVFEERYERLDDGWRLNHARLKKVWQLSWSTEEGVSTVQPYGGGIHQVGNTGSETAISVHLYGPRIGELDGRDYYPSRDYVCARTETPEVVVELGTRYLVSSP